MCQQGGRVLVEEGTTIGTIAEKTSGRRTRAVRKTVLKIDPTADRFVFLVTVPACDVDELPVPLDRVIKAESRGRPPRYCSDTCCNTQQMRDIRSRKASPARKRAAKAPDLRKKTVAGKTTSSRTPGRKARS